MDILVTLVIGAAGGVFALVVEHIFLHFKEKRSYERQRLVRFPQNERIIDGTIFNHLRHGASIELMKSALGTPNKIAKYDSPVFLTSRWEGEAGPESEKVSEDHDEVLGSPTYSYLYNFKNADVKITSKDNETIDSLTVISNDGSIRTTNLIFPWSEDEDLRFGQARVTKQMVDDCRPEHIQTRWDNHFALSLYVGSPTYDFVTYFGYLDSENDILIDKEKPESFIGGTIDGVCLSQDDRAVYYIYLFELR